MHFKIMLLCLMFTIVCISSAFAAGLCDICQCTPVKDNPLLVHCNSKYETLTVSGGKLTKMHRVKQIIFNNFKTLSFERNAFSPINSLETLIITNSKQVVFPAASLTNVRNINITNVRDLMLTSNASIALQNLENLYLTNVSLTNLPEHAFYDMYDLKNVILNQVYIKRIESRALDIVMDKRNSKIVIMNTIVDNVEKNGINLDSYEIHIDNTEFHSVKEAGISLESKSIINVRESLFNKLQPDFITLTAPNITFINNSFTNTDIALFSGILIDDNEANSTQFQFENNIVEDLSILKTLQLDRPVYSSIFDNKILYCSCNDDSDVLLKRRVEASLRHNYCVGVCEVSVYDFLTNRRNFCIKYSSPKGYVDVERLCFKQENSSENPEMANRSSTAAELWNTLSDLTTTNNSEISTTVSTLASSTAYSLYNISLNLSLFYLVLGVLCYF